MSELLGTLRAAHYVKQVATCMGGWPCKNGPLNCKGDETTINPYKPMLQKGLNPSTQRLARGGPSCASFVIFFEFGWISDRIGAGYLPNQSKWRFVRRGCLLILGFTKFHRNPGWRNIVNSPRLALQWHSRVVCLSSPPHLPTTVEHFREERKHRTLCRRSVKSALRASSVPKLHQFCGRDTHWSTF